MSMALTGSSSDYRSLTLLVHDSRNPGTFYFLDQQTKRLTKLGDVNFEVRPEWLVGVDAMQVQSKDGTSLEAFLARPETTGDRAPPLVVIPHGGPIGIHDDRSFDPLLQFSNARGEFVQLLLIRRRQVSLDTLRLFKHSIQNAAISQQATGIE